MVLNTQARLCVQNGFSEFMSVYTGMSKELNHYMDWMYHSSICHQQNHGRITNHSLTLREM